MKQKVKQEKIKKTLCEEYKLKIKDFLTKDFLEELNMESLTDYNDVHDKEENNFNKWNHWAKNIDDKVKILITDNEGDRENAHYMPKLADYLIKDVKLLPLWSCICRDRFGYGRVPASSASVESDFNIIKNIMLKTEKTPMRADEFVMKHVNFMSGRIKIANVNTREIMLRDTIELEKDVHDKENNEIVGQNNIRSEKECPACANGHEPTGGHTCYVCKKYVHALDGCSISIGEEGYEQQRICVVCQQINNVQDIIATKEIENWRGLVTADTQPKGRYLQKDSIRNNFLLNSNICKIPIMKNGNDLSLRPVHIGKEKCSLTNTCAFDSILQLFLAAYFDIEIIRDLIFTKILNFLN